MDSLCGLAAKARPRAKRLPLILMRLSIRLNEYEAEQLARLAQRESTGVESPSEFMRLLLHREINKSLGLPAPSGVDFATAFRRGRPRKLK